MAQKKDYCKIELTGPDRVEVLNALKRMIELVEEGVLEYDGYLYDTHMTIIYKDKE